MKTSHELQFWIQLLHAPGIGPKRYNWLLKNLGSPQQVLTASISQLKSAGLSEKLANNIANTPDTVTETDMQWLAAASNHHIVTIEDSEYPALLRQIDNPPCLLFVHGEISILNDPQLAMVGSRNPTQGGRDNAYEFAKYLARNGLCITSGLALGIDGFSHKGALDSRSPTIAVTGTGLDRVYPARHRDLAHAITEQGAIISEYPVGTPVRAQHFPRRNRIISGMSVGTLVVEAAIKSGSLITARYASEQGREVFAIPGSIHNPLARGCHQLIRQGAKLVETAEHILEEIAPSLTTFLDDATTTPGQTTPDDTSPGIDTNNTDSATDSLDPDQRQILEAMGYDPLPVDCLVERTGLTIDTVSSILLILELHGHVEACGSGQYIRLKSSVSA